MTRKTDLRVIKTREGIRRAFLELIREKGYDAITIQDIAERSMTNRNTFYLHYTDKKDLLETVTDEVLDALTGKLTVVIAQKSDQFLMSQAIIRIVFEHVLEHSVFCKAMLGKHEVPRFHDKMKQIIHHIFHQVLNQNHSQLQDSKGIPNDFLENCLSSLYIGTIVWWVEHDFHYSAEQMTAIMSEVITKGPIQAAGFIRSERV
ncbi:transcriptional regulator, TetR family [Paenibacillus sp. 1_12]|uniref:TetR/AcrR family transcriptional regulator n=1 Tax=Paenibacillus sp. 1_12 TaxID=1566278 RepID=UPI0008E595EF|nr:TetR/AcrR family transcriptional regulator [Paenibacillus sp. 1_12]SFL54727.1 transcriptional regulator, TetR family [Paenibacillus sp. 1_12]